MELMKILKRLHKDKKITRQQFRTYKGQVLNGDAVGCIVGMMRKGLLTEDNANALISFYGEKRQVT